MVKKTKTVSKTKIVKADPKSIGLQQTGKVYIKPYSPDDGSWSAAALQLPSLAM
jgi:hypothetical protein